MVVIFAYQGKHITENLSLLSNALTEINILIDNVYVRNRVQSLRAPDIVLSSDVDVGILFRVLDIP